MPAKQPVSYRLCPAYANRVRLRVSSNIAFVRLLADILVCINHVDQLCACSPRKYCLWYRYTIEEMTDMLDALRQRLDLCQKWKLMVNRLISTDHQTLIGKQRGLNSSKGKAHAA